MFTFNLEKEWFDKIKSGEKRVEYRLDKPFWRTRVENQLQKYAGVSWPDYMHQKMEVMFPLSIPCAFVLGYTKNILKGRVINIDYSFKECTDLKDDDSDIEACFCFYFELDKDE